MTTMTVDTQTVAPTKIDLDEKSLTFSLADLIREGARVVPEQAIGTWGTEESACALSAGVVAARRLGIIPTEG